MLAAGVVGTVDKLLRCVHGAEYFGQCVRARLAPQI